jgi:hypothetical protein
VGLTDLSSFDRAHTLAKQGYLDAALDALADAAAGIDDLTLGLDDQERVTVERGFDPPFMARLQRLGGAFRDKHAGVWRVPARGLVGLVALIESMSRPHCSTLGCTLGDDHPPTQGHLDAHRTICS